MGIYVARDVECEDDGDLVVTNGDLVVTDAHQTMRQYILNWMVTTRRGYSFDPEVGWGAEAFLGRPNNQFTHRAMERDLRFSVTKSEAMMAEDLNFNVSPVDLGVAGLTVAFTGTVVNHDDTESDEIIMAFSFPFTDGQVALEVENSDS